MNDQNAQTEPFLIILAGDPNLAWWPLSRLELPIQFQKTAAGGQSGFQRCVEAALSISGADRIAVSVPARCMGLVRDQLAALGVSDRVHLFVEPGYRGSLAPAAMTAAMLNALHGPAPTIVLDAAQPPASLSTFRNLVQILGADPAVKTTPTICATFAKKNTLEQSDYFCGERISGSFLFELDRQGEAQDHLPVTPTGVVFLPPLHLDKALGDQTRFPTFVSDLIACWQPPMPLWADVNPWMSRREEQLIDFLSGRGEPCIIRPVDTQAATLSPEQAFSGNVLGSAGNDPAVLTGADGHLFAVAADRPLRIIATPDATLISDGSPIASALHAHGGSFANAHARTAQSTTGQEDWGTWTMLAEGGHFQTRQMVLRPHATIGPHFHADRNERLVVLAGAITVRRNERDKLLETGETISIARGDIHSLVNRSAHEARFLELRFGNALSDADTVQIAAQCTKGVLETA